MHADKPVCKWCKIWDAQPFSPYCKDCKHITDLASRDQQIAGLRGVLSFYMSICGNTCGAPISRETAQEMYDMGEKALNDTRSIAEQFVHKSKLEVEKAEHARTQGERDGLRNGVDTLKQQLTAAQQRVQQLEERLVIDPGGSDRIDELESALEQTQQRAEEVERKLAEVSKRGERHYIKAIGYAKEVRECRRNWDRKTGEAVEAVKREWAATEEARRLRVVLEAFPSTGIGDASNDDTWVLVKDWEHYNALRTEALAATKGGEEKAPPYDLGAYLETLNSMHSAIQPSAASQQEGRGE